MDEQTLNADVEIAEEVDDFLHQQSMRIEDVQGSLEAVAQAIVADGEPKQLTDHQQKMVDSFKDLVQNTKGDVYAVADSAALETYRDANGVERNYAPLLGDMPAAATLHGLRADHGPNVWGTFSYGGLVIPGNEGFMDMTIKLVKKAAAAFSEEIPSQFKITAKGLEHYAGMAQRLRERLLQLKPLLDKQEFPFENVFEYGTYSRFFQINGESIGTFSQFQEALQVQHAATRYVFNASESYGLVIMQQLLEKIQAMQAVQNPSPEDFIALRDSVEYSWKKVWKDADITPKHGQTPQAALNAFPDRRFISLVPLLDNRYLVAHEPKSDGGKDPVKISSALKHYGASVVFDKNSGGTKQTLMNVPNTDELSHLVDEVLHMLQDFKGLELLAKKNNDFAKSFKKASEDLAKKLDESSDPQLCGYVTQYFKLVTAACQAMEQPYTQMAWMYIRSAMIVVSLVELTVLEEPKKRFVTARFATRQNTEFSNPALESFQLTEKLLKASKRIIVS
jgi:hypothetical protein